MEGGNAQADAAGHYHDDGLDTHANPPSTFAGGSSSVGHGGHALHIDASMRETFARRARVLGYIKRCLSSSSPPQPAAGAIQQAWLDTVYIARRDVEAYYDSDVMRKRAGRYYVLGCSLAPTVDLASSAEFVRAVLAVLHEVETLGESGDKEKTKMRNFFKSSIRGQKRLGMPEFASTLDGVGVGGPSLSMLCASGVELIGTHVPFPLDFVQTTIALCDVLTEVYCKLSLFLTKEAGTGGGGIDGLPNVASASEASFPTHISGPIAEGMQKIDGKLKKMLAQLCKELDVLARQVIRNELASIDPLMARDVMDDGGITDLMTSSSIAPAPNSDPIEQSPASAGAAPSTLRAPPPTTIHGNVYSGSAPNLLSSYDTTASVMHVT